MTSKSVNIEEFLTMTIEDILKLPSQDGLPMQICKTSYSHMGQQMLMKHENTYNINSPLNIQILALTYFFKNSKISSERSELFNYIFPKLKDSLNQAFNQIFGSINAVELILLTSSAISSISDIVDLTVSNSVERPETIQSLLYGVLDLVLEVYKLLVERDDMEPDIQHNNIDQLTKSIDALRTKLIGLLILDDTNYFPDQFTGSDVNFFIRLISVLCEMAKIASVAGHVKTSSELWKCILILCTNKILKSTELLAISNLDFNCMEYLSIVTKTVCHCIHNSITNIYESPRQLKSVEVHSKFATFLTSVLQRLASSYSHDAFRGHEPVLTTLLTLMKFDLGASTEFTIIGLQNVLVHIWKSNEFCECFYRASCELFPSEILDLGLIILSRIQNDTDNVLLQQYMHNENLNIVSKMLKCLSTISGIIFREKYVYNDLVTTLSCILVKSSKILDCNIVARVLVKSVLQNTSILVGYLLTDMWILWIKFLSEEQCYDLFLFLSKINESFSIVEPIRLQSVHIANILQNLYKRLSLSLKQKLCVSKSIINNVKLWSAVGLHCIPDELSDLKKVHFEIEALLNSFLIDRSAISFYRLIEILRLLETTSPNVDNKVPDWLMMLWRLDFTRNTNKYSSLISTLVRISILYEQKLTNSQYYHILKTLVAVTIIPNLEFFLKLEIINFLRHISVKFFSVEYRNEILQSILLLFNRSFNDLDPLVKETAFLVFAHVVFHTQHDAITLENITVDGLVKVELQNFIKKNRSSVGSLTNYTKDKIKFLSHLDSCSSEHKCIKPNSGNDDGNFKENDLSESRIKEIIYRIQKDTTELMELNRSRKMTKKCHEDVLKISKQLSLIE